MNKLCELPDFAGNEDAKALKKSCYKSMENSILTYLSVNSN